MWRSVVRGTTATALKLGYRKAAHLTCNCNSSGAGCLSARNVLSHIHYITLHYITLLYIDRHSYIHFMDPKYSQNDSTILSKSKKNRTYKEQVKYKTKQYKNFTHTFVFKHKKFAKCILTVTANH